MSSKEHVKKINTSESEGGMFPGYSSDYDQKPSDPKIKKLTNAFKKQFIPPTSTTPGKSEFWKRLVWTVTMILSFILIIYLGNFYCSLLIFFVFYSSFFELMELSKKHEVSVLSVFLNWYFFFTTLFFMSFRLLSKHFIAIVHIFPKTIVGF